MHWLCRDLILMYYIWQVLNHPVSKNYPPSLVYKMSFVKYIMKQVCFEFSSSLVSSFISYNCYKFEDIFLFCGDFHHEVQAEAGGHDLLGELYEFYAELVALPDSAGQNFCFKSYNLVSCMLYDVTNVMTDVLIFTARLWVCPHERIYKTPFTGYNWLSNMAGLFKITSFFYCFSTWIFISGCILLHWVGFSYKQQTSVWREVSTHSQLRCCCCSHIYYYQHYRRILEMGSGLGLTGIALCLLCKPHSYCFTDYHEEVLDVLSQNVTLNLDGNNCYMNMEMSYR